MTHEEWTRWEEENRAVVRVDGIEVASARVVRLVDSYPTLALDPETRLSMLRFFSMWFEVFEDPDRLATIHEDLLRRIDALLPHPVEKANSLVAIADSFAAVGRREQAKKVYERALEVSGGWGVFRAFELEEVRLKVLAT